MPALTTSTRSAKAQKRTRRKKVAAAKYQSRRNADKRAQIAEINRHLDEIGDRVFGPTHSGPYTPKRAAEERRKRANRPGAELRTAEAADFRRRLDEAAPDDPSIGHLFGTVGRAYGKIGEEIADFTTGIPTFIRDPSLANAGWVAASVVPVGRLGRLAKTGVGAARAGLGGRAAGSAWRAVGDDIAKTAIPAARSRTGRALEQKASELLAKLAPGAARRSAGREIAMRAGIEKKVTVSGPRVALERLAKKLSPSDQYAAKLVINGTTPDEVISYRQKLKAEWLQKAADAEKAVDRARYRRFAALQDLHIDLAREAAPMVEMGADGTLKLAAGVSDDLTTALRLHDDFQRVRESMAFKLDLLDETAAAARIQKPGIRTTGIEDFSRGRGYLMDRPGVPGVRSRFRDKLSRAYIAQLGGRRQTLKILGKDPSFRRQWTGYLQDTGAIDTTVTDLTADQLARADRLVEMAASREILLDMSQPITREMLENADDLIRNYVAIRVRPTAPGISQGVWTKLEQGIALNADDAKHLARNADEWIEQVRKDVFPKITDELVEDLASGAYRVVPLEVLDAMTWGLQGWKLGTASGGIGKALAGTMDNLNDLQRIAILYSNPGGYIGANLVGNAFLMSIQQGIFMPRNIKRAWDITKILDPEDLATLDELAGVGGWLATGAPRGLTKKVAGRATERIHWLVDLGPRRTAWLHEAARLGYQTGEIGPLLKAARDGSRKAMDDIYWITRKANDALVDFDRLGPIEKRIVSKAVFLYPWLKGSARYSVRFPVEHPVLTAAGAAGAVAQQRAKDENLGPGPFYEIGMVEIPQAVKDFVPYMDADQQYVTNLLAVLPQSTVVEFGQLVAGIVTGDFKNAPNAFGYVSPVFGNVAEMVSGHNLETGKPLPESLLGRLEETFGRDTRAYRLAKEAGQTARGEQEGDLYPYGWGDLGAQLALGSVAPRPRDPETAAEIVAEPEEKRASDRQSLVAAAKNAGAPAEVVREYNQMLLRRQQLDNQIEDGATSEEKARAAFAMAKRVMPKDRASIDQAIRELEALGSEEAWQRAYENARAILFSDYISRIESAVKEVSP